MLSLSARRIKTACAFSATAAAMAAALLAPGSASAGIGAPCSGTEINGEGSTLQKLAMTETWNSEHGKFHTSQNKFACKGAGKEPNVTYNTDGKTGSIPGMKAWYEEKTFGPIKNGFVGTDFGPSKGIKEKIEAEGGAAAKETLLTIPTLQASVAVLIHLPTGCEANSTVAKAGGRLALYEKSVEKIFRGQTETWKELLEENAGTGDEIKPASCETEKIQRMVREEGSGTTNIFKKYLALVDFALNKKESKVNGLGKAHGEATWSQSSEIEEPFAEEEPNKNWPEIAQGAKTVIIREHGGGKLAEEAFKTPDVIGYANLADAGTKGFRPAAKETFWAMVQNNGVVTTAAKFADPSTENKVEKKLEGKEKTQANCEGEKYTNGKPSKPKKFPPPSTKELWNEVTTKVAESKYGICGFTYDLSLSKYSLYAGTTEGEATTANNFFRFVTAPGKKEIEKRQKEEGKAPKVEPEELEGGQELIEAGKDYLGLPYGTKAQVAKKESVQDIAAEGAAAIEF